LEEIKEITGMRGLAVLAVLAYHDLTMGPFHWIPSVYVGLVLAGWSGVDFFFVLSAFLLTKIYYRGLDLRKHYVRRFFRTWPLYYVSLPIFVLVIGYHFSPLDLIYAQNFLSIGPSCSLTTLCATGGTPYWTLTLEEIFYVLLPLWFWIWKRYDHNALVLGFALLSVGYRALVIYTPLAGNLTDAIMLDRQLPSFLVCYAIGTWLALEKPRQLSKPMAVFLLVCAAYIYGPDSGALFTDLTFGAAWGLLILAFAGRSRFFSSRPMQLVGKWSYAIYILQWPFLVAFGVITGTVITFAAAGIAHYAVERPLIGLGRRLTTPHLKRVSREPAKTPGGPGPGSGPI
jgi:peptidoglycan/LPS O-acetylase OafA/YrhL